MAVGGDCSGTIDWDSDLMPHTQDGLPFASGSHTSYQSAVQLRREGKRGAKMRRLLEAYSAAGARGLTDLEASDRTGLPVQSITSLRNAAIDCGLVRRDGQRMGRYQKMNYVWILVRNL